MNTVKLENHKTNPVNEQLTITGFVDDSNPGGGCTKYQIKGFDTSTNKATDKTSKTTSIVFQNGNPAEVGVNGVTIESLLAIIEHKLEAFQSGPFACHENGVALQSIQAAQFWLKERTNQRKERGVEGTHTP